METAIASPTTPTWTKERKRVVASSFLGSTIEFYDLILYATATSVVFGPVFFSELDYLAATIASYATFAVAYISRPVGGILFGHFGDRIGRKRMLILSMMLMGVASTLIGLVPAIPTFGAMMLIFLRVIQGIAIGGEWGGAALMSLEHSHGAKRGMAASFTNAGGPAGAFLGTVALALAALLPREQFLSWGWRIPFLFSAVLLAIGLYVRSKVSESPVFLEALQRAQQEKHSASADTRLPLLQVLRHPRGVLTVGFSCMGAFVVQALYSTFGITYASARGVSTSQALWAFAICQLGAVFFIVAFGALSDRIGRRPVMIAGLVGSVVVAFPVFAMLGSGSFVLVTLAFVLALSLCQSLIFGPMAAFSAEHFGTRSRYTGASLGYQLASLLGAGFTPVIAAAIMAASNREVTPVVWYVMGLCAISALVVMFVARESRHNDIYERH